MSIDQQQNTSVAPSAATWIAEHPHAVRVGAAGVALLGTLMPWVSVLFFKISGMDVWQGMPFWAALGAVGAIAAAERIPHVWVRRGLVVGLPAVVAAAAVYVLARVSTYAPEDNEFFDLTVSPQPGLFITAAGAVACVVLAVRDIRRERTAVDA